MTNNYYKLTSFLLIVALNSSANFLSCSPMTSHSSSFRRTMVVHGLLHDLWRRGGRLLEAQGHRHEQAVVWEEATGTAGLVTSLEVCLDKLGAGRLSATRDNPGHNRLFHRAVA